MVRESTSLQLGALLTDSVDYLLSTSGLILSGLLWVVMLLSTVVTESLFAAGLEFLREYIASEEMRRQLEGSDISQEELLEAIGGTEMFPLAFDLPVAVLLVAVLLLPIVSEAIQIVAVRVFAARELDGIPGDLARRRILVATLLGWFGGILLAIGIGIGLLLLIIPGIFIAVATIFYRQEIAVADKGIISGIKGSWNLTKGHRIELFGLLVVLFGIAWIVGLVEGLVLPEFSIVSSVVSTITTAVLTVFSIAVVTAAYVELRRGRPDTQPEPREPDLQYDQY
jgi:hypothetical protein